MTYPSIPEMNRIIAEFDGWIFTDSGKSAKKGRNGNSYPAHTIRYHDKWFWLKPVIDKIFTYALAYPDQVKPIIEMRIVVNIKAAHERVFEFAKWYKENCEQKLTPEQINERKKAIDWYRNPDKNS